MSHTKRRAFPPGLQRSPGATGLRLRIGNSLLKLPDVSTHLWIGTYIRRIYDKLHVRSRSQAVAKYAHLPVN